MNPNPPKKADGTHIRKQRSNKGKPRVWDKELQLAKHVLRGKK